MNGGVIFRFPLKRKQILIHPNIGRFALYNLKNKLKFVPFLSLCKFASNQKCSEKVRLYIQKRERRS